MVYENGKPIGPTPTDGGFVYYGNYHYTLVHDGFETLQVDQHIPSPWYEYAPIDFFAENLLPWRIKDVRRFHYQMAPLQNVPPDQITSRAQQLRDRAAAVGSPPGPTPQAPAPAPPIVQPQLDQPIVP
jgi:hypothetical protein